MKEQTSDRSMRNLTLFVMIAGVLVFSQLFAASKKSEKEKMQATRVIYSGQFRGHVEPCG